MTDEQLYDAARDGKTAEATQLLAAGADPNGHRDEVRAGRPRAPAAPMPAARHSPHEQHRRSAPPPPRARCCAPPLAHPPCAPRRCCTWQKGNTALILASSHGHTAIAQALLGAGADLNAKNNVRPPRRRHAPAAVRRRSLTRRVRRAAAPSGRVAGPPSSGPATKGTRRSCKRCWTRGQTSTPRAWYARPAAAARPLLRAVARSPAVYAAALPHLTVWLHRPRHRPPSQPIGGRGAAGGGAAQPARRGAGGGGAVGRRRGRRRAGGGRGGSVPRAARCAVADSCCCCCCCCCCR